MALTQQQLADLTAWVDQYAAQTDQLSAQAGAQVTSIFTGVNLYSQAAVSSAAAQAAETSNTANLIAAGLVAQYLGITMSEMLGVPINLPNLALPPVRNGVDLRTVFERVAKFYRRLVAGGVAPDAALVRSLQYGEALTDYNIRLAQRDAAREYLFELGPRLGVTGFRRVVHPERSKTGTCGLCLVASDHRYNVADLMPLHARCKCTVLPIIGDIDPGSSLNNLSLGDVYDAAGSNNGRKLKRVRFVVQQHGEYGPVLVRAGDRFTGPQDLYDPSAGPLAA